jgi:hypothetical protein
MKLSDELLKKSTKKNKKNIVIDNIPYKNPFTNRKYTKNGETHKVLLLMNVVDEDGVIIIDLNKIKDLKEKYNKLSKTTSHKKTKEPEEGAIINPLTKREIKKGTATYEDLVLKGIIDKEGVVKDNKLKQASHELTLAQKVIKITKLAEEIFKDDLEDLESNFNYLTIKLSIAREKAKLHGLD